MMVWLWSFIGILVLLILGLLFKIHMLRKAAGEIADGFADRLVTDTNTLIGISGRDRQMRRLADAVNEQLRRLRAEHHRFCQGDAELKGAVTNLSHDLRTPLTAICGYLDLLEKEEKSEAVERYIGILRNRSELMRLLTEELFRYSVGALVTIVDGFLHIFSVLIQKGEVHSPRIHGYCVKAVVFRLVNGLVHLFENHIDIPAEGASRIDGRVDKTVYFGGTEAFVFIAANQCSARGRAEIKNQYLFHKIRLPFVSGVFSVTGMTERTAPAYFYAFVDFFS